jgi:hypothetical protein
MSWYFLGIGVFVVFGGRVGECAWERGGKTVQIDSVEELR